MENLWQTKRTVYNSKYIKLAGLDEDKYSTHKLRHTAATIMHQMAQIYKIEVSGHKHVSYNRDIIHTWTTNSYLQPYTLRAIYLPWVLKDKKKSKGEQNGKLNSATKIDRNVKERLMGNKKDDDLYIISPPYVVELKKMNNYYNDKMFGGFEW